jgi:arsenate reductase
MKRVLFICTHNSARSQMAEALLRSACGDRYESASAGIEATSVRPEAIAAMAELGIDISTHYSKTLASLDAERFDWAVTVCDEAHEACPAFHGADRYVHWSVADPSRAHGSDEERLVAFRVARDELANHIHHTFGDARG